LRLALAAWQRRGTDVTSVRHACVAVDIGRPEGAVDRPEEADAIDTDLAGVSVHNLAPMPIGVRD
jgi:hypothetical protein